MKKKIIAVILITYLLICGLCSCEGDYIKNEYGQTVFKMGPYIEISSCEATDVKGYNMRIIKAYHEETKEIVEIICLYGGEGITIRPLWDYDDKGHPIVQYYEEGEVNDTN